MQHIFGLSGEKKSFVFDFACFFLFFCFKTSVVLSNLISGFFPLFSFEHFDYIILFDFIFVWRSCWICPFFIRKQTKQNIQNWSGFLSLADSVNKPTNFCARFKYLITRWILFIFFWIFSWLNFPVARKRKKSIKRDLLMQISTEINRNEYDQIFRALYLLTYTHFN